MEYADELKGKAVNGPTDFADKAGSHPPTVSIEAGHAGGGLFVGVTVEEEMKDEHWIQFIWAKDSHDKVIAAVKLAPTDKPCLAFDVPPGTTAITCYEQCNIHGVWASDTQSI